MANPARLSTEFTPDSNTGRLWEDMQAHYLREHCPPASNKEECLNKLEGEVHVGYISREHNYLFEEKFFDPAKIFSGEVFRYAYRFEEYYPYLIKHGFPITVILKGLSPAPADDKNYEAAKREIFSAMDEIKEGVIARGLIPETPEYQLAIDKAVHDWGIKNLSFDGDCPVEETAWGAFKNRCGRCTEKSAILYSAYAYLGRRPQFVEVIGEDPTPLNFVSAANSEDKGKNGHVCIGLPVAGRDSLLLVDVAKRELDPSYRDVAPISLYGSSEIWRWNRLSDLVKLKQYTEAELAVELSPGNPVFYCALWREKVKSGKLTEAKKLWKKIEGHPVGQLLLKIFLLGNISDVMKYEIKLRKFGEEHPKTASRIAYAIGDVFVNGSSAEEAMVAKQSLEIAAEFFTTGMGLDDRYIANYVGYVEICEKLGRFKEAAEYFEGYLRQRPGSVLGHYLAAMTRVNQASLMSREEIKEILEIAEMHMDAICKLDDCNSRFIRSQLLELRSFTFFLNGNYAGGVNLLKEAYSRAPEDLSFHSYWYLWWGYLATDRCDKAMELISKTIEFFGDDIREFWGDRLIRNLLVFINLRDERISDEEDKKQTKSSHYELQNKKQLISAIKIFEFAADQIGQSKAFKDKASAIYLLMIPLAVPVDDIKGLRRLIKKAGSPISVEAQEHLAKMLGNLTGQLPKISISDENFRRFLTVIKWVKPLLKDVGQDQILSLYVQLAGQEIKHGRPKGAQKMFESAIAIDASKAFKAYEGMLKDIVHVAFEQESETTKLSAMLAMELCLQTKPRCPDDMLMVIKNDAEWFKENGYKDRAERLKARINKALEQ